MVHRWQDVERGGKVLSLGSCNGRAGTESEKFGPLESVIVDELVDRWFSEKGEGSE